jgi:hypothetical protein
MIYLLILLYIAGLLTWAGVVEIMDPLAESDRMKDRLKYWLFVIFWFAVIIVGVIYATFEWGRDWIIYYKNKRTWRF